MSKNESSKKEKAITFNLPVLSCKIGQWLTCTKDLYMRHDDKRPDFREGVKYEVIEIDGSKVILRDDDASRHGVTPDGWLPYFIAQNGFGLGEVAEPEAKLEHRTLKLRTND